ncbi:hypothetical protein [Ruficoccus sp. ZRK36]|uniref:hypothetical protein n=1 Tax=Ruficoccus sp. ZRK36 TaxID=2866311 RepID=UPI001C732E58|nr:hypothetical protein [Ruficoccus sp. ZRK36]QYY36041.1 hypothetical protein K0V07_00895 [Ruficoccus sp. ZRK36]
MLILTVSLIGGLTAHAQDVTGAFSANTRPAYKEELTGVWEMTFQRFTHPVEDDPQMTARYQVFSFGEDGVFKNITATRRVSNEDRETFLAIMPENTHWEMPKDGLLVIRRSQLDADGVQAFVVTQGFTDELLSGSPALKRGDVVLIYQDKYGNPYLRRYLRLMPLEQ